jgi:hypothetical protein
MDSACCSCGPSIAFGCRCPTGASREGSPCAKTLMQAMIAISADASTASGIGAEPFLNI